MSAENGEQPFRRFKELAKKLLAVPKKELDRKMSADKKRKKAGRRKFA